MLGYVLDSDLLFAWTGLGPDHPTFVSHLPKITDKCHHAQFIC
jgi:hypothetical protein